MGIFDFFKNKKDNTKKSSKDEKSDVGKVTISFSVNENINSNYEDNSSIYNNEMIDDVIDEKGYVQHDLWVQGEEVTSLGKIKKVYGDLNIYSDSLLDLGELNYVKGHVWVKSKSLSSLGNLERVGKDLSLKNSSVTSLGKLFRVGGKLNLRDTDINDLSNLKYVKTLFLPKRLEGQNIDFIETKKIRYWKDLREKESKIKNSLNDVGGNNLRYSVMIHDEKEEEENELDWIVIENSHDFNYWYSKLGFKLGTLEFPISEDPKNRYYISKEKLTEQFENFEFYKNQLLVNPEYLNQFDDDDNIRKLRDRLIYDLVKKTINGLIKINVFINQTIFYEKIFSNFKVCPKLEFLNIYKLLNLDTQIDELLNNSTTKYLSYSKIHEMELRLKKRQFYGETIVSNESLLNDYIQKNIEEFYTFVDEKLNSIYGNNFSLFHSLFGELSTVEEINNQFPSQFKIKYDSNLSHNKLMSLREKGIKYFKENLDSKLFQKYIQVLESFETDKETQKRRKYWRNLNSKSLWLGYNVNPMSYCDDHPDGNVFNFFIENILHGIFNSMVFGLQNDFRVSKGIPKIGEGWVSETELYYLLKDNLSTEEIIHHGKPKWLGRQHVDIWFPKRKIGIEYQGIQHDQPVEYFGGEEGYKKGKERDERKKRLFKENNSILIEIRKGYDIEEVIKKIKKHF